MIYPALHLTITIVTYQSKKNDRSVIFNLHLVSNLYKYINRYNYLHFYRYSFILINYGLATSYRITTTIMNYVLVHYLQLYGLYILAQGIVTKPKFKELYLSTLIQFIQGRYRIIFN